MIQFNDAVLHQDSGGSRGGLAWVIVKEGGIGDEMRIVDPNPSPENAAVEDDLAALGSDKGEVILEHIRRSDQAFFEEHASLAGFESNLSSEGRIDPVDKLEAFDAHFACSGQASDFEAWIGCLLRNEDPRSAENREPLPLDEGRLV